MILSPHDFTPNEAKGFIVLEGVNGAGKSTLQLSLKKYISDKNFKVTCSHEPGGTPLGKMLRSILLSDTWQERDPLAEALLFSADRAEHITKTINPALSNNEIVLLDRYYYSTVAFQGFGRGFNIDTLLNLSQIATSNLKPDLVILLDLDPALGLKRNEKKGEEDSFEDEALKFHKKIRNGFLALAERLPEPFVIIDATKPANDVFSIAANLVDVILEKRKGE